MKKEQLIILGLLVLLAVVITITIYYLVIKKKGTATTQNSKTLQDIVDQATPGEQKLAKENVDAYKDNFNENFSEAAAAILIGYSDAALAWAATYYKEQTGRLLYTDIKNLPYYNWSTFSYKDGDLMKRLEKIGAV